MTDLGYGMPLVDVYRPGIIPMTHSLCTVTTNSNVLKEPHPQRKDYIYIYSKYKLDYILYLYNLNIVATKYLMIASILVTPLAMRIGGNLIDVKLQGSTLSSLTYRDDL